MRACGDVCMYVPDVCMYMSVCILTPSKSPVAVSGAGRLANVIGALSVFRKIQVKSSSTKVDAVPNFLRGAHQRSERSFSGKRACGYRFVQLRFILHGLQSLRWHWIAAPLRCALRCWWRSCRARAIARDARAPPRREGRLAPWFNMQWLLVLCCCCRCRWCWVSALSRVCAWCGSSSSRVVASTAVLAGLVILAPLRATATERTRLRWVEDRLEVWDRLVSGAANFLSPRTSCERAWGGWLVMLADS